MAGLARAPGSLPGIRRSVLHVLWALGLVLEVPHGAAPAGQALERAEGVPSGPRGPDSMVMFCITPSTFRDSFRKFVSSVVYLWLLYHYAFPLMIWPHKSVTAYCDKLIIQNQAVVIEHFLYTGTCYMILDSNFAQSRSWVLWFCFLLVGGHYSLVYAGAVRSSPLNLTFADQHLLPKGLFG